MNFKKIQYPISGFPELLPHKQLIFDELLQKIRLHFQGYGFLPVETCAFERKEVLGLFGSQGIRYSIVKEIDDNDGKKQVNDFGLRYDLTLPLARYVTQNMSKLHFPFKRYQIQKVWRGERPQAGRYHEFYQCDVDVLFSKKVSIFSEAELVKLMFEFLRGVDIGLPVVRIGNNNLLKQFLLYRGVDEIGWQKVAKIIKKINRVGRNKTRQSLSGVVDSKKDIDDIIMFCSSDYSSAEDFKEVVKNFDIKTGVEDVVKLYEALMQLGVRAESVKICPGLSRGLFYYTGNIYEIELADHPGIGHICAGGRYDNLVKELADKKIPGLGISIGLTRLFNRILKKQLTKENFLHKPTVFFVNSESEVLETLIELSSKLRNLGLSVDVYPENVSVGKQMKYADQKGHDFVLFIPKSFADDEKIIIRRMNDGEKFKIHINKIEVILDLFKNRF